MNLAGQQYYNIISRNESSGLKAARPPDPSHTEVRRNGRRCLQEIRPRRARRSPTGGACPLARLLPPEGFRAYIFVNIFTNLQRSFSNCFLLAIVHISLKYSNLGITPVKITTKKIGENLTKLILQNLPSPLNIKKNCVEFCKNIFFFLERTAPRQRRRSPFCKMVKKS